MTILQDDIKLLKSSVMADTSDGGGPMTGIEVIDGQSNNLLPDTSVVDRALGRFQARKVFGVAHSGDTDTLQGAHAIITEPPSDPLVHSALMKSSTWAERRSAAREAVEKYLVKGPKLGATLYDTHYAGSLQIRLISFVNSGFPGGGEAVVLRNPDGTEQYLRFTKVDIAYVQVAIVENGSVLLLYASVATCNLGQPLSVDFFGPPAARVTPAGYAEVFSTNVSGGARFYGIKRLGEAAAIGDLLAVTEGGIYTPIVPAATVESPIVDQQPSLGRGALGYTASAFATISSSFWFRPNERMTLPTAIEPKSITLTHGGVVFTDDGTVLKQGTTAVADIDYRLGVITVLPGAPNYGSSSATLNYKPATRGSVSVLSAAYPITIANQGLVFTNVFRPAPAPGTFSLSYMAQGRWYTLNDNLSGKLSSSEPAHGTGSISYTTGSMSLTLGAIPDIGSPLIAVWGDESGAKAVSSTGEALPTRLSTEIALNQRTKPGSIAISWTRSGAARSAVVSATGVISGDATGVFADGVLQFEPAQFPVSALTIDSVRVAAVYTALSSAGGGDYTLTGTLPVVPNSFRGQLACSTPGNALYAGASLAIWDVDGVLYAHHQGLRGLSNVQSVGTINYATGAVHVDSSATFLMYVAVQQPISGSGFWQAGTEIIEHAIEPVSISLGALTPVSYAAGSESPVSETFSVSQWKAQLKTLGGPLNLADLFFTVGSEQYTAVSGTLRRGWNMALGTPTDAAAGTVTSEGLVTVTGLTAVNSNVVIWVNAALDASPKRIFNGVFRTASAPLKPGVFQLLTDTLAASANDAGVILGGDLVGTVDYQRGVVTWARPDYSGPVDPSTITYNAVFLQYLPLDVSLLGLDTARLPLDGKVPIFRAGDLAVVHNTLSTTLPNPAVRDTAYSLGRVRIATLRVKDATGALVPSTRYVTDMDAGSVLVPAAADLTGFVQPLTVQHRIEDMMVVTEADISGQLKFTRSLTHAFPAETSYISSALAFGDLFSRAYNYIDQSTWTGVWSDELIGTAPIANFNEAQFPIVVTNRGAITERWALIFTNNTAYRIIGESVGEIGTGNTGEDAEPLNPATAAPYFSIPYAGWGGGRSAGNVLRFNTAACGSPFWVVRTVLQGPATLESDQFSLAFRGDIDRP